MTAQPSAPLPAPSPAELTALAAGHGLDLDPESLRFNEAGLDYRVVFATALDGEPWVLRLPRRPDVSAKLAEEALILDFLKPRLDVAVPDWRIKAADLIAYPLLPGTPGLTLDDAGQPVWHFDTSSEHYATSLGQLIAALHSVDVGDAAAAGVNVRTSAGVRDKWRADIALAKEHFTVADSLLTRWSRWIDDDSLWPDRTVLTHGELYPAHLLLGPDDGILSVLDWTTAAVGDPALDFMFQQVSAPPEAFTRTVDAYRDITGWDEPRLADRCAALMAAAPVGYATFALETGDPGHLAAASALLAGESGD
ncbi:MULTISPECIES: macrolide 2'-phosphotransferase [unclassified Arthrobacter]|uniref:macrolide 2'-phosphotransferase n=1 Tax=unclassified Arthrobacter TaxID=235627 RepID=UPI001490EF8A|nr:MULTISPECIES: macrolide 2'-phosphotransferase [unclassified Arthrobacter]MBE0008934.1 aminoglycoside phosphotransferase [Arthrobacter sp. AET 35A]NOJ62586.1 phosphotransferase [Arthrobacter sp. 147(2020)]